MELTLDTALLEKPATVQKPRSSFLKENRIHGKPNTPVKRIGTVDFGSNSLRYEGVYVQNGRFVEIKKSELRVECALGKGMEAESGSLNEGGKPCALNFCLDVGRNFIHHEIDIGYIVGTAALRHSNDEEFIIRAQNAVGWGMAVARKECTLRTARKYIQENENAPYDIEFTIASKEQESVLTGYGALLSNPEMSGPYVGAGGKSAHGGIVRYGRLVPGSFCALPIGHLWLSDRCHTDEEARKITLDYLNEHEEEYQVLKNPSGAIYLGGGAFRVNSRLLATHVNRASITSRFLDGAIYHIHTERVRDAFDEIGDPAYVGELHAEAAKDLKPQELANWEAHWKDKIGHREASIPVNVGMMQAIVEFSEAERLIFYRLGLAHGIAVESGYVKAGPQLG